METKKLKLKTLIPSNGVKNLINRNPRAYMIIDKYCMMSWVIITRRINSNSSVLVFYQIWIVRKDDLILIILNYSLKYVKTYFVNFYGMIVFDLQIRTLLFVFNSQLCNLVLFLHSWQSIILLYLTIFSKIS